MGFQFDISVGNAAINMYAKCGSIDNARQLFDTMPERDVVSWTSVITGYARNEHGKDALEFFARMLSTGTMPNQSNLTCVLGICTSLAALEDGKQIHAHSVKTGFVSNVNVGNVLVSMYAKCGEIDDARLLFERMCESNVMSWNSMIVGYAENGRTYEDSNMEFTQLKEKVETLQRCNRHLLGEDLDRLTIRELQQLEQQLDGGLHEVISKKNHLMFDMIEDLQRKEQLLEEANKSLQKKLSEVEGQYTCDQYAIQISCSSTHPTLGDYNPHVESSHREPTLHIGCPSAPTGITTPGRRTSGTYGAQAWMF